MLVLHMIYLGEFYREASQNDSSLVTWSFTARFIIENGMIVSFIRIIISYHIISYHIISYPSLAMSSMRSYESPFAWASAPEIAIELMPTESGHRRCPCWWEEHTIHRDDLRCFPPCFLHPFNPWVDPYRGGLILNMIKIWGTNSGRSQGMFGEGHPWMVFKFFHPWLRCRFLQENGIVGSMPRRFDVESEDHPWWVLGLLC